MLAVGRGGSLVVAGVLATLFAGCANWGDRWDRGWGGGWSDQSKVQVQFYAPPGAEVMVRRFAGSQESIVDGEQAHRLERNPDDCASFNLSPGASYDFKYISAEGIADASVYGELEVRPVKSAEAKRFVAHTFVPISLPSEFHDAGIVHRHPTRGPSGVGLSALELDHLRQGDLVRKVYFIADLQRAWESVRMIDDHIERLRSAETVLNTELELVDSRFQMYRRDAIYSDPTDDPLAANRDRSSRSATFVRLEAQRQRLENTRYDIRNQVEDLLNEKRIRTRLLDSMRIVNRRGSLVLATPENQWEFHDAAEQISSTRVYPGFAVGPKKAYTTSEIALPPLGEVLVILRVGGRHMHWGPAPPVSTVAMSR